MQILDPIGNPASSDWILIQPVDDHDQEMLPQEMEQIRTLLPDESFALFPVKVDWFRDLAPWTAPAAFRGQPDFGSGAEETLQVVLQSIVAKQQGKKFILGGYSLAGFFALWAGYQTDAFEGIVAASPSVWYPGWIDFAEAREIKAPVVYLSLGKKEEKVRHPLMKTVGDNIRRLYEIVSSGPASRSCTLEMNPGNHFVDADLRMAKGFAWVMEKKP